MLISFLPCIDTFFAFKLPIITTITCDSNCLQYVCFVLLLLSLVLVDLEPLQHVTMKLFATKKQWLESITIVTKSSIFHVASVLDSPLKIIDK